MARVQITSRTKNNSPRKDRQFVTALARGLEVLRCFSSSAPELGTAEIARKIKLPQPTVWRLCHTLTELGFLTSVPGRDKLRLGIPVLGLGYAVLASYPIAALARPYMQRIADSYQGAVSLGAGDGLSIIYIQRCQGPSIVFDFPVGTRVPMAHSSTGWAYLAALPPEERSSLLLEFQAAHPKSWRTVERHLKAALHAYEDTGWVINKGIAHSQVNAVGVPVQSENSSTLLALSAGGISSVFDDAKLRAIGKELKALASKLAAVF